MFVDEIEVREANGMESFLVREKSPRQRVEIVNKVELL